MTTESTPTELPPTYDPTQVEPVILQQYLKTKAYAASPDAQGEPYAIVIPPPNVTSVLHVGHALNSTLQDVLVRMHRMKGFNTLWMPGTDHAGIATQTIVDKRLQQAGQPALKEYKQQELEGNDGRGQFIEKVQAWKDEYEQRITNQLKEMGCSCDWDRQRFTMDDQCAQAVRQAFFQLFKDGLIYRGKRLVNWDPVSQTALADDEVEMEDVDGNFYYMKYPIVKKAADGIGGIDGWQETGEFATVATTRPETMLGDTAVAVNPDDEPRAKYIGQFVKLPIVNRIIPIVGDDYVVIPDPDSDDGKARMASGFLKVTPAHDPNDYEIGNRHDLAIINVMAPDASISIDHGWPAEENPGDNADLKPLVGLAREEARKQIVKWFKENDLMPEVKPYRHAVGHSYRSHVPIEPYYTDQWYVKVTDDALKGEALRAMSESQRQASEDEAFAKEQKTQGGTGVPPVDRYLKIHKRNLPHWEVNGSTYFVTFRLLEGQLPEKDRQLVVDACMHWHGHRMDVHLVTVMPDHVHLLITPAQKEDGSYHKLEDLLHSIKSFTAHELNKRYSREGPVWQEEYFDRIMRDEDEFTEKWNYMQLNPVKAGLVDKPEAYAFSAVPADHGRDARATSSFNQPSDSEGRTGVPPVAEGLPSNGDAELIFTPDRYAKTFQNWHENIRDWCISRQLWWGHRIPVWSFTWVHDEIDPNMVGDNAEFDGQRVLEYAVGNFKALIDRIDLTSDLNMVVDEGQHAKVYVASRSAEGDEFLEAFSGYLADEVRRSPFDNDRFPGLGDYLNRNQPDLNLADRELNAFGVVFGAEGQDPDVLDTWFSSALWPLSTLGWPNDTDELQTWNPTSVLCTAREIITLWVSRMVMFNRYFKDSDLPFNDVYIHAMIQDGHGQKMSKSLGNGVDPLDIIHSHGADAMRFALTKMATQTQDVRLPVDMVDPYTGETFTPEFATGPGGVKVAAPIQERGGKKMVSSFGVASGKATPTDDMPLARNTSEKFDEGQRFANKMWNAFRFALSNLEGLSDDAPDVFELELADRWILNQLTRTIQACDSALAEYRFSDYATALYDFFWRDLCDWYIEIVKRSVKDSPSQQRVLAACLDAALRLMHPAMPFITERLWQTLNAKVPASWRGIAMLKLDASETLIHAAWPKAIEAMTDADAERDFELIRSIVIKIREARTAYKIPPKQAVEATTQAPAEISQLLLNNRGITQPLTGCVGRGVGPKVDRPAGSAAVLVGEVTVYLHDCVDVATEKARLEKLLVEKQKQVKTFEGRLANKKYVDNAPAHLVQETRDQHAAAVKELEQVEQQIAELG